MLVYSEMLLCMAQRCLEIEAKQKGAFPHEASERFDVSPFHLFPP